MRTKGTWLIGGLIIGLLGAGCTIGPEYTRPELQLPEKYQEPRPAEGELAQLPWKRLFQDIKLQELIRIALQENKDLLQAVSRVDEARALAGFTRADQLPRVDVSGSAERTRFSDEVVGDSQALQNSFGLFGLLSFELDIWGKLRRATEAQRAQLLSTEYAQRAVTISLISQVVTVYLRIIGAEERLAIAQRTIANRTSATNIMRARFSKGVIPELDVNQAEIEEQSARLVAVSLEREIRQAENLLRVLLGRARFDIPRGQALDRLDFSTNFPTGYPASLLQRRPDVIAAEAAVKAQVARVGVAMAQRLPSLSLSGDIGLQSRESSDLFASSAFTWGIGGGLLGPVIDFGKNRSRVEVAEAQAAQAYLSYQQSVLRAVQEVEDALIGMRTLSEDYGYRTVQVRAAANASRLSRARYDEGATAYLEVLDSERSLFEAELGKSESKERYLGTIVQLYRALGGGWEEPPGMALPTKDVAVQ